MLKVAVAYASVALTFMVLDAIWLSTMGALLYRPILGPILAENVRVVPAVIFYAVFVAGIIFFCVLPALESGRWTTALLNGAVFGFLAYATYDLTNHATLSVWDTRITLADMAWGTFVSGVASVAGYFVTDWMVGRG